MAKSKAFSIDLDTSKLFLCCTGVYSEELLTGIENIPDRFADELREVRQRFGYGLEMYAEYVGSDSKHTIYKVYATGIGYIMDNFGTGSLMDTSDPERLADYKSVYDWNPLRQGNAITGRPQGSYQAVNPFDPEQRPITKHSKGSRAGENLEGGLNRPLAPSYVLNDAITDTLYSPNRNSTFYSREIKKYALREYGNADFVSRGRKL